MIAMDSILAIAWDSDGNYQILSRVLDSRGNPTQAVSTCCSTHGNPWSPVAIVENLVCLLLLPTDA